MKPEQIVAALQSGYVSIKARFVCSRDGDLSDKTYTYKALNSLGLAEGDWVVVMSPVNQPVTVYVEEVSEFADLNFSEVHNYKWVIQKVDTSTYDNIIGREMELTKKISAIMRQQTTRKFVDEFSAVLDGDPNKDAILKELADLGSVEGVSAKKLPEL